MTWSDVPQVLFELLWPFVLVFSFVVLVKAKIRRYRSKRRIEFKTPRWLFVVAAVFSLVIFLLLGAAVMDPWTTELFMNEQLNKDEAQLFFMMGMAVFIVLVPLLITPLVCRFWPKSSPEPQRNNV